MKIVQMIFNLIKNSNSEVKGFLIEAVKRFLNNKKPDFFVKLQWIFGFLAFAAMVVTGLSSQGIEIPTWLQWLNNSEAIFKSLGAAALMQFANKNLNDEVAQ